MPARIQRKRTKGWRAPAGAVYVGRGTRWGNPWAVVPTRNPRAWAVSWTGEPDNNPVAGAYWVRCAYEITAREQAVRYYRDWAERTVGFAVHARVELAGRDLMCWCPAGDPCHADVLIDLANRADGSPAGEVTR